KYIPLQSLTRKLEFPLYAKRFFPYYVHNILVSSNEQGKGSRSSFNLVGSHDRETRRVTSAMQMQSLV
ncbi:hypothetical protein EXIGLDRAFT_621675, partial [Exidia glandulosa HHB12029]